MSNYQRFALTIAASIGVLFSVQALDTFAAKPASQSKSAKADAIPSIKPLHGKASIEEVPVPTLEDLNQCAGTMSRYTLPPTGYIAKPESRESIAGKALYAKYDCASCHAVDGRGGNLGPPLDGIGGHRGKQWLVARLLDPETQMKEFPEVFNGRPNIMPHLGVKKKEATEIAEYLLTLPEPTEGFLVTTHGALNEPVKPPAEPQRPLKPDERKGAVERGKQLFIEKHCAMCHTVSGTATRFGPRLDGIAAKLNRQSIERLLSGGARDEAMRGSVMGLTDDERESIVEFLLALPPSAEPAAR